MVEARKVATVAEIPPGEMKVVEINDCPVVVRNIDGTLHAIENVCPHRGGPVGEGEIDGNTIACPWHGWAFDLDSCQSTMNPAAVIRKFPCRVEGDDIIVDI